MATTASSTASASAREPSRDELSDALSDASLQDSPRQRLLKLQAGQSTTALLQSKRRRAQMRLVNLRRGAVQLRSGEPRCLEMFVADLTAVLAQPRCSGGQFAPRGAAAPRP